MDKNAEMIITRHRALFSKPGDLKELVKLPIKRKNKEIGGRQEALIVAPFEKIRDIVTLL